MIKFLDKHEVGFTRALEIVPGLMAWGIIVMPAIGGWLIPNVVAYGLLVFIAYWFFKSFKSAFFSILGYILVNEWSKVNWHEKWRRHKSKKLEWDKIKHVVIIPNYNESVPKLQQSLDAFAAQPDNVRKNMFVFLAMEERAKGSRDRAKELINIYKSKFGYMTATFHPAGLPGEVVGKASNETWAAREAKKYLDSKGIDLDIVTVTSCDADAQFNENYFAALTYSFATLKERYLRFWQSPIFWYNNLHTVPFPIKMLGVIGHAIHLSDLQEPSNLIFNYSCYSLSFKLLHETGYWHTDIIPEDWHLFLQTFFNNKGNVGVEPIYLPTYIDAPESKTWFGSLKNRYEQCKRHAWGATDIPYAIKESIRHPEIPFLRKLARIYKMIETHVVWSTNWFVLTLGATVPVIINDDFARTSLGYNLPRMAQAVLTICLLALVVMVIVDILLRPDKAKPDTIFKAIKEVVQWAFLPVITLPMSVLPGLHAQTMLMFGKRLEYKVTEKV
jgi:hypothetical protein